MILFSVGPIHICIVPDAGFSIYYADTAWVVHLWIIELSWDCIRNEDRGPVQKDCDQPGHGSSEPGHELVADLR